jgi:hypothetical protein
VYGNFCSPECAVGHLFNEHIDVSTKFERYHLLNNLYNKIFKYENNIPPAPNPHYLLDKFCGTLTIQEYRQLFHIRDKITFVIEKPLTYVFPELQEENVNFVSYKTIIKPHLVLTPPITSQFENKVNVKTVF